MSVENRKAMYDKLVAEGKLDQIDDGLIKEFGDPKASLPDAPKEKISTPNSQKKKGQKKLDDSLEIKKNGR